MVKIKKETFGSLIKEVVSSAALFLSNIIFRYMESFGHSFLYEIHSPCGPRRLNCMLKGKIGEREGSLLMPLNNLSLLVLVKA